MSAPEVILDTTGGETWIVCMGCPAKQFVARGHNESDDEMARQRFEDEHVCERPALPHRNLSLDEQAAAYLQATLWSLRRAGIRRPDELVGPNVAKWVHAIGTGAPAPILLRVDTVGGVSLDPFWFEAGGRINRLLAPRRYQTVDALASDLAELLAIGPVPPTGDLLASLRRAS